VLRSAQKGEHAAPDLPKREALLSDGIQGTESDEGPVEILGKRRRTKVNCNRQHSTCTGFAPQHNPSVGRVGRRSKRYCQVQQNTFQDSQATLDLELPFWPSFTIPCISLFPI